MNGMAYEALVVNGQIELPPNVLLPEHAKVLVVVPQQTVASWGRIHGPRLAHPGQARDFEMDVRETSDAGV